MYGYKGGEPDETGLVYYRARYYDPTIGRFTQRDPIGLQGGINQYLYVQGNPTNLVDPSGLLNILVPGTDLFGLRSDEWLDPNSNFSKAVIKLTHDEHLTHLPWEGGNHDDDRQRAAADLVNMVNSVPGDEPVRIFAHSHGGNVVAIASSQFTRTVELVVTMGTPVRSDYNFDMTNIKQGVALSTVHDGVQANGGNTFNLWPIGEFCFGCADRVRKEPGFENIFLNQLNGHSEFHENPTVTIGAVDNAIKGSGQQTPFPPLAPYSAGGTGGTSSMTATRSK